MRKIVLFILLLLPAVAPAQNNAARIEFERSVWDFGPIKEVDGPVSYTFRFRNAGSAPLVILSVGVTCGCTTPRFSKAPIPPGKSGEIQVSFDPENRPGPFEKSLSVNTTDPRGTLSLLLRGQVIGRPRTLKDDYPYYLSDGLRMTERALYLGPIPRGRVTTRTLGVANDSDRPLRIGVDAAQLPAYIRAVPKKSTLAPRERSEVTVSVDGTQVDLWGMQKTSFSLLVNDKSQWDQPIELSAIFTEDFSKADPRKAPIGDYSSLFYHFSNQPAGRTLVRQFFLSNSGAGPLVIRYFGPSSGRIRLESDRMTLAPGETATLTATVNTAGVVGQISEGVVIITNDPVRPARELRLLAEMER